MKFVTKSAIAAAATAALIGGAAFAAPSFAVDSTESPQTQSQEMRQLNKGSHSAERGENCDLTEAEKAAHRAEHQASGEGKQFRGQGPAKGKGPQANS